MKEIEIKIIEINKKEIEKKLKKIGAKKVFEGVLEGYAFDFPDERIKKAKNLLRLRKVGEKSYLTYKENKNKTCKAKICEETEFEIMDFEKMIKVLNLLGLGAKGTISKHRTTYSIGKTHFEIEEPIKTQSFIPPFLEIEAPSVKVAYKYAKELGFGEKSCLNWTGWDIARYYSKGKKPKKSF